MNTRKTHQPRPKGQSLIAAGKIYPEKWNISKDEALQALQALSIPAKEVKKVHCLKHQVCVSYWNLEGKVCSSFFSYRCFMSWQQAVKQLIADCQDIPEWNSLGDIIEYDLVQFPYPAAMANTIWDTLKNRWYELRAADRESEIERSLKINPAFLLAG